MRLYNGTGCLIFLVGSLRAMPMIEKHNSDTIIIVTRNRHCCEKTKNKIENYRVVLNSNDAHKIIKFGFPGMILSILGDLRGENKSDIIAEKIDFIDFENANKFDAISNFDYLSYKEMDTSDLINTEMPYWYTRDGSMRREFRLVH